MEVIARKAASFVAMAFFLALLFAISLPAATASMDDAPSPSPVALPASDGTTVDQGIAYVLMLLALIVTYIIH